MKPVWLKIASSILIIGGIVFFSNRVLIDGGITAVLRDEVTPLRDDWFGKSDPDDISFPKSITASVAVLFGIRAGAADYNKGELVDSLIHGLPRSSHKIIMQNDNLASAKRARKRQLIRFAATNPAEHFQTLFREWLEGQMKCLNPHEQIQLTEQLNPELAVNIRRINDDFALLDKINQKNRLTVSQRESYLSSIWRVPQVPTQSFGANQNFFTAPPFLSDNGRVLDPSYIKRCDIEGYIEIGQHKNLLCNGYVAVTLFKHSSKTDFEYGVQRQLTTKEELVEFVAQMMEQKGSDFLKMKKAEQLVSNMSASEVPTYSVARRVKAEYMRLRCQAY